MTTTISRCHWYYRNADEMVYAKPRTAKLLSITFDDYGDSCVDDIDVVRMKKLFCSVERKVSILAAS